MSRWILAAMVWLAVSAVLPALGAAAEAATWAAPRWAQVTLVPFAAPGGGTVQIDGRLQPALTVLANLEVGRPLVDVLARGGVRVEMADLEEWGHYVYADRVIRIDDSLIGADPRAVAALLAHETSHARGDVDGIAERDERTVGEAQACVNDEQRATEVELQVWQQVFGPRGKQPALNEYEELVNEQLAAFVASAEAFRASASSAHAAQCYG